MRLAPNRPSGLMASTRSWLSVERRLDFGRSTASGGSRSRCSSCEHALGRAGRDGRSGRVDPRHGRRQYLPSAKHRLARLHCRLRLDRAHLLGRDGSGPRLHAPPGESVRLDRAGVVHRPLRRILTRRLSPPRLDNARLAHHRYRPFHDLAGGGLCRAGRARPHRHEYRQAPDERDLRHGHLYRGRALGDLHQAQYLVSSLPDRLARADPRIAAGRALVLRALRRPRDRARDQAGLRLPAPADGARQRLERARRSARVRPRAGDEPPLQRAPRGAEAPARGGLPS